MNSAKRKRLESKGFKVGSVLEFLDLSLEVSKMIELKITLGRKLQAYRKAKRLTQIEFANLPRRGAFNLDQPVIQSNRPTVNDFY